ncbi:MAG: CoA transferase [Porticoccaceae bacterium]|nr:CoA transferase [Porticoccaceae bacterium]
MTQRMLEGFKVIDFTHVVAGPHCTKILAEHGAEVIKIEPLGGELARMLPMHREERSGYFIQHNVGKKTMAMDISTKEGQDICHGLIKQADVVVENFSPGVMKQHNLDWETLKEINPDLIMCSISCFGQTGPLSHLPGYDWIGQSYAGIIDLTGEAGRTPVFGEYAFGDVSTGAHAYGAIVTALMHRLRGGKGQYIDISLVEVLFSYHEMNVQVCTSSKGQMVAKRSGAHHGMLAPVGIYKCGERFVFLLGVNHQWAGLTKAMGREDMLKDPRFSDLIGMGQHKDEINAAVEEWLESVGDADKAVAILQEHGVPCAPILTIPEVIEHPHSKARGTVRTVNDAIFGEVQIPRTPLRFSEFPEPPDLRAGTLGQHNHEILREQLNYSEQQIANLETQGIIGSKNI